MATEKQTADFILQKLSSDRFSVRPMFGEYAIYADGKVVGLICDNTLYVKILPASKNLEKLCEKDAPYPGAKDYYVIEEDMLSTLRDLPKILFSIADSLPIKKSPRRR